MYRLLAASADPETEITEIEFVFRSLTIFSCLPMSANYRLDLRASVSGSGQKMWLGIQVSAHIKTEDDPGPLSLKQIDGTNAQLLI
jgi:hypothetical protein